MEWFKSGAYQAWARAPYGDYYVFHGADGKYVCQFVPDVIEQIGRFDTVEEAKAGAEEHLKKSLDRLAEHPLDLES